MYYDSDWKGFFHLYNLAPGGCKGIRLLWGAGWGGGGEPNAKVNARQCLEIRQHVWYIHKPRE